MLDDLGVVIATLDGYLQVGEIIEDADTLCGNALKKAREVFRLTGVPSLADDTGLEVHYLNDAPGVFSSRYAGPGATYHDNVQKLLRSMRGVPERRRAALFRCVLAFVAAEGKEEIVEGVCRGAIIEVPRGTNGFGYDPVFLPDGYQTTFAEMDLAVKNRVSHRGLAIQELKKILPRYLTR